MTETMIAPAPPLSARFTAGHLWALAVLVCIWGFVATHPIRPHDFWWHMAIGRQIVQTGQIPTADTFSYTAFHAPYFSYHIYWLADVLLYLAYAAGGPALSVCAHALLITLTYGLLLMMAWRLSNNGRLAAALVIAAAALGFENWNLRPQALAFLLSTVFLWQVYEWRRTPTRSLWQITWFPGLMLIWVNCHGSFPLGLLLVGFWLLETLWQRKSLLPPFAALLLTVLAMWVGNPAGGLRLLGYLAEMGHNPIVRQLPEWAPAYCREPDGLAFFVLLTASAVLLVLARKQVRLFHLFTFVAFAGLAWSTGRAIVWFGIILVPLLAEVLSDRLPPRRPEINLSRAETTLNAALAGLFVLMAIVTLPWFKDYLPLPEHKAGLISSETPQAATTYLLHAQPPAPLFHHMSYGSYLIWAAQPKYRVFVDPRIELYPARIWQVYDSISRAGPRWQEQLDGYGVNTLLLSRQEQPFLIAAATGSATWRKVYQDRITVIFVRSRLLQG